MDKIEYTQLSSATIKETRKLVVSSCSKGGFTLAQQMVIKEGKKKINMFLKGAIHIDGIDGLYNLRDALNLAIEKSENLSETD